VKGEESMQCVSSWVDLGQKTLLSTNNSGLFVKFKATYRFYLCLSQWIS